MKTITDFKKRMKVGAILNSQFLRFDKEISSYTLIETIENRVCKVSQSNSFALTIPNNIKEGQPVISWCDWPRSNEFCIINENTIQITKPNCRLTYQFIQ